jgi:autotransporter-associated beta strand protein
LTLTGVNTYTGATTINGGALIIADAGDINASSGVIINGAGAKLAYNLITPLTPTVTLTNGTLDGTGIVNSVVVGNGTGGILTHGDGGTGSLTIGSLTFNGAATVNLNPADQYTPEIYTTTLTTNAAGSVTINASNAAWSSGDYYLITYTGSIGGAGFSKFQKGAIAGLSSRQSATLTNPTGYVALSIVGENPYWTGAYSSSWTTATIPSPKNWSLPTLGATDYIAGDTVIFADSASNTSVAISDADVAPSQAIFSNAYLIYTIDGPYGITGAGKVAVSGTGGVTINTNNSYTGGTSIANGTLSLAGVNTTTGATTINSGTLNINNANALGSGALTINGGTIDNTSGAPVALATTNVMNWSADFAFGGSNDLDLGPNDVALTANRTVTTNGTAKLIVSGAISGNGFGITKSGSGSMVLSGANTNTGSTIITNGTLEVSGGTLGDTNANIQISPNSGDNGTFKVSDGTVNADRVIIGGNSANTGSPSNGYMIQTGGVVNSREWFTVGSGIGAGGVALTGQFDMSGGTLNVMNQQMEVGNFGGTTGIVNMSGSAAINLYNNQYLSLGANNDAAAGTFNQNGGTVTFYSDAGTTVGGNGILYLGRAGTTSGTFEYYLNGGTLTVPQISKNTSNTAYGNFYFGGGTLKAAKSNATWMQDLSSVYITSDNNALIDSNGYDVTIAQPIGGLGNGGLEKLGAGTLTLAGYNYYYGSTIVSAGTLILNATGDINSSSDITINGTGAKFVLDNSDPYYMLTSPVNVQNGTLDGVGSVNTVTVADGTGGVVANGNGTAGVLTINSLTYNGTGAMNLTTTALTPSTPVLVVSNLSTSYTPNSVVVNASSPYWNSGTYDLVQYASLSGTFSDFALGTVSGLTPRQSATLTNPAGYISLQILGYEYISWSGAADSNWTTAVIPSPKNWMLGGATATDFITSDAVVFDDSATGTTAVEISDADVSPVSTRFDNNTKSYTISSAAGFGIATGFLTKSGTGTVTINTANTYSDGTTLDAGTLNINNASAIGTGALTINGGAIGNTSGADITLSTNNALNWNGNFTFAGPNNLNMGTSSVVLTKDVQVTVDAGTLTFDSIPATAGLYSLTKAGAGNLDLSTTTNNKTVISGTLNVTGGKVIVHADVTVNGLAGTGTIENGSIAAEDKWFFVNNAVDNTFDGIISGGVSKLGLNKSGAGKLTLTNSGNVIDDAITLNQGTLVFNGTHNNTTQQDVVGNTAGTNAILDILPSTTWNSGLDGANWWNYSMTIGNNATAAGRVCITDSTSVFSSAKAVNVGLSGYGSFKQTAGTSNIGSLVVGGNAANGGTVTINGGTMNISAGGGSTIGFANSATRGDLNISGDAVVNSNSTAIGIMVGEAGIGVLNISDSATLNVVSTDATYGGLYLGVVQQSEPVRDGNGIVNLNGGTIATTSVHKGAGSVAIFNFNGGTLKAQVDNTAFMTDLTGAYVYAGGAVIDDNGKNITIGQSLLAPTGDGVSSAGMDSASGGVSGGGYIDRPLVTITGDGVGATAVANIDSSGNLTSITMTNPGVGYTSATFTLSGGGQGNTGAISALPTFVPNTSGGLTKKGTGTLTLSGINTYTGDTSVVAGTLDTLDINTPSADVSVAAGDNSLIAKSITANSLTIGAGAKVVIKPIAGGPLAGGSLSAVPEPSTWAMIVLAAMGLGIYLRRSR